jgi:hypothetical protein
MSDSFRPAMIGLALAILTMTALILWFFLARITLYQSSASAVLQEDGQILASFSAETFAQIQPGQAAVFRMGQAGDQRPVTLPAQVFDTQGGNEKVIVIITDPNALPANIAANQEGRVDVETESIPPVELLLRAAGKFLSTNQAAPTPQTNPQSTSP